LGDPPFHLGNPLAQLFHQLGSACGELPIDALHLERVDDGGSVVMSDFSFKKRRLTPRFPSQGRNPDGKGAAGGVSIGFGDVCREICA
jgi:hypothetical protein